MKCNEIKLLLSAYADRELARAPAEEVGTHLRACKGCSTDYRALTRLHQTIQSGNCHESAPATLVKRVSSHLKGTDKPAVSWPGLPATLVYSLPALLLGLFVGWATQPHISSRNSEDDLLQSLASAHVHSLMADHLTDIASSDTHTVKPWFHGRIDFSPPVEDLTREGYPLIGGRLEYLADDYAVALVYRHRQHTINLFIAPGSAQTQRVHTAKYNGYNMIHWEDGYLSYWAVSDLNPANLDHFRTLLDDKVSPEPDSHTESTNP